MASTQREPDSEARLDLTERITTSIKAVQVSPDFFHVEPQSVVVFHSVETLPVVWCS